MEVKSDNSKLPGQQVGTSSVLKHLYEQAKNECNRDIYIQSTPIELREDFIGQIQWRDHDVLVQMDESLEPKIAEYIAAHELGHVIQFARGYPKLLGNAATSKIVRRISDFLLDTSADSIAIQYGFPIAPGFEYYFEPNPILSIIHNIKDRRKQGNKWERIWAFAQETIECEVLCKKMPNTPRDLQTLWSALGIADIIQRSSNLGISLGNQILDSIETSSILHSVIIDLLNINLPSGACSSEGTLTKCNKIIDYLKAKQDYLSIYRPLTGEFYINDRWQQIPKQEKTTKFHIQNLFKDIEV